MNHPASAIFRRGFRPARALFAAGALLVGATAFAARTNFYFSPMTAQVQGWVDTTGVYGVMIAHVGGPNAARDHFSSFYSSPVLAQMTRDVWATENKNPKISK